MTALLLALWGCSTPDPVLTRVQEPEVSTWVDELSASGGTLTAQVVAPVGVDASLDEPRSTGLTFTPQGDVRAEQAGDLSVVTQTWAFTGKKGSYVIDGPSASWGEDGLADPPTVFVDLGVDAPREGELADITDPLAISPFPTQMVLIASGVAVLFLAGLWFAFKPRSEPPAPAPLAPDVAALRAWAAASQDASLDDHGRALAISGIFRTYTEAVLAFPATSMTSSEILRYLAGLEHLAAANQPRAKALLRATDRVKFADEAATHELFERLGADLEAFVQSTRPRTIRSDSGSQDD